MKVAIYSRGLVEISQNQLRGLIEELRHHNIGILLHKVLHKLYTETFGDEELVDIFEHHSALDSSVDFFITLGGDGTLLSSIDYVRDKMIPILGINFGRLGFLASTGRDEISIAIEALINGTYLLDKRILIHFEATSPLFGDSPFALNEFAIYKKDTSPMIKISTYINGEFLNDYWADGLIVATPTGSTGYNMSCNGPIAFPDSSSFMITPIAPHNLNVRPIVVPDNNVISFEVESRENEFICALDSKREIVTKDVRISVKKEQFSINLIRLKENSFLTTLRSKLAWGLDKRN